MSIPTIHHGFNLRKGGVGQSGSDAEEDPRSVPIPIYLDWALFDTYFQHVYLGYDTHNELYGFECMPKQNLIDITKKEEHLRISICASNRWLDHAVMHMPTDEQRDRIKDKDKTLKFDSTIEYAMFFNKLFGITNTYNQNNFYMQYNSLDEVYTQTCLEYFGIKNFECPKIDKVTYYYDRVPDRTEYTMNVYVEISKGWWRSTYFKFNVNRITSDIFSIEQVQTIPGKLKTRTFALWTTQAQFDQKSQIWKKYVTFVSKQVLSGKGKKRLTVMTEKPKIRGEAKTIPKVHVGPRGGKYIIKVCPDGQRKKVYQ